MKIKALLYCNKAKPYLYPHFNNLYFTKNKDFGNVKLNGKIVAECDFEVEEIFEDNFEDARDGYVEHFYTLKSYDDFDEGQEALLKKSCLQKHELSNYLGFENGYAIHIKNLHIFDKPRELNYYHFAPHLICLLKEVRNMQYVYSYEGVERIISGCEDVFEKKIIISVSPQEMCRIANKEQTILVRKVVLKEMLKND